MPTLSFMEEMKDKASRLIPSQFTHIVEETTKETLATFNYEHIMVICDHANSNPDNVSQIVRAVRRRLDNSNSKVQYFTVLLIDALIKNCYEELHNEVAVTKALQRGLVNIAVKVPTRDGEYEAKKCALTLILNMSYWFIGATSDETKMLSKLADEVRSLTNPLVFEDIEADPAYQLKRAPPSRPKQQRQRRQNADSNSQRPQHPHGQQRTVTAIPVYQYTGEQIDGMLDACSLLSECLNEAEKNKKTIIGDEIITGIAVQVRSEHRKLSIVISSGAEMENMDVLLTVSDCQTAIIQSLQEVIMAQSRKLQKGEASKAAKEPNPGDSAGKKKDAKVVQTGASEGAVGETTSTKSGKTSSKKASKNPRKGQNSEGGDEMGTDFFDDSKDPQTKPGDDIDSIFQPPPQPGSSSATPSAPPPYQIMDPEAVSPDPSADSINNDLPVQQDDFDAFLNSRSKKGK